jgi:RNA polymerase sigma factor (TIGR02999 family)
MGDISLILAAIERGDEGAVEELLRLVRSELRYMAAQQLRHEAPGHTLQPTALVNEVYLRLFGTEHAPNWESRRHFFAAASEAMRRILVDGARRKKRFRHGGGRRRVEFDEELVPIESPIDDLLALDEALEHLARIDPEAAELVKRRFFSGLSTEEAAEILGLSVRTAYRKWNFARAWLFRHLHGDDPPAQDDAPPSS